MLDVVAAVAAAALQAAVAMHPVAAASAAQPTFQVADDRSHLGAGAAPVTDALPEGTPITGDLSGLRPSEQLKGRQQALRAHVREQLETGERPWLPAY
jgi:hypothetical protein